MGGVEEARERGSMVRRVTLSRVRGSTRRVGYYYLTPSLDLVPPWKFAPPSYVVFPWPY